MQYIILKNGIAEIPDGYEILGDRRAYKHSEGIVVIEFRHGSTYHLPHAVFPTEKYKRVSDAEEILAYHAILSRHPKIVNLMRDAKSPKELIGSYRRGVPTEDHSIWPGLFPLYRQDDEDYEYLVANHMIHGSIIPN